MRKRILWLLTMAALCVVLTAIVVSRADNRTEIIFGGAEGAYVHSDSMSFVDPDATPTPEPTEDIWPDIDITLAQYRMVNDDTNFLLPSTYAPDCDLIDGTSYMLFDRSALPYLNAMIEAANKAGFTVYIAAAYRTYSYQTQMYNAKASTIAWDKYGVTDYMDERYQQAAEEAKSVVMYPGSSEHQLGLAVDIMDKNYKTMIYEYMNQDFFEWLDAHCAEYGFIKRYPTRKLLLTGWDEPWHYRYVGTEAAAFIMENGLCYEEFYKHYVPDFKY